VLISSVFFLFFTAQIAEMQTKLELEQKASSVILEASVEQETLTSKGSYSVLSIAVGKLI